MSELNELRQRLDELDRKLVELLGDRMRTVETVQKAKRAEGVHLFDRQREREVVERAEKYARELGVSSSLVTAVFAAAMEASHALQEHRGLQGQGSDKRSFLIVGGRGRMGRFFDAALSSRGHSVSVLDKGDALEPTVIQRADVVIVAVPMNQAEAVVTALAPLVRDDALLCDINSLKKDVCKALATSHGEALGTHPMFGPTVTTLRRQKVVLCPVKPGPMGAWFEAELGAMGAEVIHAEPSTHDEMMAVIQVLTHFGIMVTGRALAHSGVPLDETLAFMSPIYRLEVAMVGRLFSQKPELYGEILMSNPAGARFRELFITETRELAALIERGDRQAFVSSFRDTAGYFRQFSGEAMALSDQIIDTIMSVP